MDRIDDKATVVGTFDSSDLGTVVFAVLDKNYYKPAKWSWLLREIDTPLDEYKNADEALTADRSATYNTDYIIIDQIGPLDDSSGAFSYCRSIEPLNFNGKTYDCQLPNYPELQMIYNNREKLAKLDPNEHYTSYNLAKWDFGSTSKVWSSNEAGRTEAIFFSGTSVVKDVKSAEYLVIPIIEIPLEAIE